MIRITKEPLPVDLIGSPAAADNAGASCAEALRACDHVSARRPVRRKLWQVETSYHCSIVGTCLDDKALAKAERASGASLPAGLQDYERHGTFVANCANANPLSRQLHKALGSRHRRSIEAARKLRTTSELEHWWDQAVEHGEIAGPYWALMTHPAASGELMAHAFGQVHMLSHEACASNRSRLARLNDNVAEIAALRTALTRERRTSASLREQCRLTEAQREASFASQGALVRRVDALARALADAEAELRAHTAGETVLRLEHELDDALRAGDRLERKLRASAERVAQLEAAPDAADRDSDVAPVTGPVPPDRPCDLGGAHVAYVGGLVSAVPKLREAVEARNGVFLHHDAGLEDGAESLGRVLDKAELVFCPVDCVSHGACQRAKRHCQRRRRQFVPLRSAGVSSFVRGLESVAG